jgi:hypothetical protein
MVTQPSAGLTSFGLMLVTMSVPPTVPLDFHNSQPLVIGLIGEIVGFVTTHVGRLRAGDVNVFGILK